MIIVPVSGGKDSQACLQLAIEQHGVDKVEGLFCDTQFEHPLTYQHVDFMSEHYGVLINKITAGSVDEKVLKYNRFPGGGARHCTEELKIIPSKKWYKQYAEENGGFEVWCGVRTDESHSRRKRYAGKVSDELYDPHEFLSKYPKYLGKLGVRFRLPIIDWTAGEVLDYLAGQENPLYRQGFDRVGCFPCLAGGDAWKEKAFTHDEFGRKQYDRVKVLEQQIGKSVWTSKKKQQSGCAICSIQAVTKDDFSSQHQKLAPTEESAYTKKIGGIV